MTPMLCACGTVPLLDLTEVLDEDGYVHSNDFCVPIEQKVSNQMELTPYVRKPFKVQAVEITADNIAEVARYVGDLEHREDGTPYILVDRRKVPNLNKVYIGFFMTKMGENVRCFSRRIFLDQFMNLDDTVQPWLDFLAAKDA